MENIIPDGDGCSNIGPGSGDIRPCEPAYRIRRNPDPTEP